MQHHDIHGIRGILLFLLLSSTVNASSCEGLTTFDSCRATIGCGWCAATMMCHSGSLQGPADSICATWFFDEDVQHTTVCHSMIDCSSCLAVEGCGWCSMTGTCLPGNASGPSQASCKAEAWSSFGSQGTCHVNLTIGIVSGTSFLGLAFVAFLVAMVYRAADRRRSARSSSQGNIQPVDSPLSPEEFALEQITSRVQIQIPEILLDSPPPYYVALEMTGVPDPPAPPVLGVEKLEVERPQEPELEPTLE
ncbi:hypothetical protein PAPYR_664 [Paratrimastix pyriformis]|uniref:PSI domain-containing protein n=1 Tax=Paratrimastix pyriformis TaxID=342808 RepID=A0ABQ8UX15_9EUKA|nr:hypothetical protein PAPYR_664 [Paratrimastix pyriformis]